MGRGSEPIARLFSYGTLQQREVQLATFGRELAGAPDVLEGFALEMLEITDPAVIATSGKTHHPILRRTGDLADQVEGTVFELTPEELAKADDYEVEDYHRILARSK
jgi:hypothetical protein